MGWYDDDPSGLRMSCMEMAQRDARHGFVRSDDKAAMRAQAEFYRLYVLGETAKDTRPEAGCDERDTIAAPRTVPTRFRKRQIEVEACKLTPEICDDWGQGPPWFVDAFCRRIVTRRDDDPNTGYWIKTLEGVLWAAMNEWVVRGVKGELYPVRNDIFAETYEAAL